MIDKRLRACFAVWIAVTASCTYINKEIGSDFTSDAVLLMEAGKPEHVDQVLSSLGPPQAVSALPEGYVFLYQHFEIQERQIGFSSDSEFLRWFKLAIAGADAEVDSLVLQFNSDNRLLAGGFSTSRSDLGEGGSVMLAINFRSLVDTEELASDLLGATNWGTSLLQRPPALQNRESSLDSGMRGLEMRGTPDKLGQRTLEYR